MPKQARGQPRTKGPIRIQSLDSSYINGNVLTSPQSLTKGSMLKIQFGSDDVAALVDTGSAANLINFEFLKRLQGVKKTGTIEAPVANLKMADGNLAPVLGQADLPLRIQNQRFVVKFLIMADCIQNVILGMPFLSQSKAILDFSNDSIMITEDTKADLVTIKPYQLPAHSETLIPARLKGKILEGMSGYTFGSRSLHGRGLSAGHCYNTVTEGNVFIRLLNPTDHIISLKKGAKIGQFQYTTQDTQVSATETAETPSQEEIGAVINVNRVALEKPEIRSERHWRSPDNQKQKLGPTASSWNESDIKNKLGPMATSIRKFPDFAKKFDKFSNRKGQDEWMDAKPAPPKLLPKRNILQALGIDILTSDLSGKQLDQFINLIYEYQDVFIGPDGKMGKTDLYHHTIDLEDVNSQPIQTRPYRINPKLWTEMDKQVQNLLDQGIVEPSKSGYRSPVLLVIKKDKSYRFCVDYRLLNLKTKQDAYNLPLVQDIFDQVGQMSAKWLSSLDLASGFFQIPLDKASRPLTAFQAYGSPLLQFKYLPMGLRGSPSSFQRCLDIVLSGLSGNVCLIYLDDIVVAGTGFDDHLSNIQMVFERLRSSGLKLKPKKCHFFRKELPFLGHLVNEQGTLPAPDKCKVIREFPIPENLKQLRSWLGISQYYKRYIEDYSRIARPLHSLTRKDTKWAWSAEAQKAFDTIKQALVSPKLLIFPDYNKPFTLTTDGCKTGLGYILQQEDAHGNMKPIAYAGRKTTKSEESFGISELELAALISGLRYFQAYLSHSRFTIETDHAAIAYILKDKRPASPRIARWVLLLNNFNFKIATRPGTKIGNADALSRRPYESLTVDDKEVIKRVYQDPMTMATAMPDSPSETKINKKSKPKKTPKQKGAKSQVTQIQSAGNFKLSGPLSKNTREATIKDPIRIATASPVVNAVVNKTKPDFQEQLETIEKSAFDLAQLQRQDSDLRPYFDYIEEGILPDNNKLSRKIVVESLDYAIIDNLLVHFWTVPGKGPREDRCIQQLVLPRSLHKSTLHHMHSSLYSGHQGIARTMRKIQNKYFWHHMARDITYWIRSCADCNMRKKPNRHIQPPLQPVESSKPFELLTSDFLGPVCKSLEGHTSVLVIRCHYSGYCKFFPTKDQTALTTAKCLIQVITQFGFFERFHSDQGANYTSKVLHHVCELLDIKQSFSTAYYSQGNGSSERQIRSLLNILSLWCDAKQQLWDIALPWCEFAINTTPSVATHGYSPYFLIFKSEPRLPIDNQLKLPEIEHKDARAFITETIKGMQAYTDMASQNRQDHREQMKKFHDRKSFDPQIKEGDFVYLNIPRVEKGVKLKLSKSFTGPFYIAQMHNNNLNATLRRVCDSELLRHRVHVSRLKKALYRFPEPTPEEIESFPDTTPPLPEGEIDPLITEDDLHPSWLQKNDQTIEENNQRQESENDDNQRLLEPEPIDMDQEDGQNQQLLSRAPIHKQIIANQPRTGTKLPLSNIPQAQYQNKDIPPLLRPKAQIQTPEKGPVLKGNTEKLVLKILRKRYFPNTDQPRFLGKMSDGTQQWFTRDQLSNDLQHYVDNNPLPTTGSINNLKSSIANEINLKQTTRIAKALSHLLRHGSARNQVQLDTEGYITIEQLLKHRLLSGDTPENLVKSALKDAKGRFSVKYVDSKPIALRANWGHSINHIAASTLGHTKVTHKDKISTVYHVTSLKAYLKIRKYGLSRMNRQFIHLRKSKPENLGKDEVLIQLHVNQLLLDGVSLYMTGTDVILSPGNKKGYIPKFYLHKLKY